MEIIAVIAGLIIALLFVLSAIQGRRDSEEQDKKLRVLGEFLKDLKNQKENEQDTEKEKD